jgi:RNA polymerase sigma factor (sigma-70 family)
MSDFAGKSEILSDYAKTLIRVKARQLVRRPEFLATEAKDLEQELSVRILSQIHRYDPSRGSINTFIARVADSQVAMIIRERKGKKRLGEGDLKIESLEKRVLDKEGKPALLWATLTEEDGRRLSQTEEIDSWDLVELKAQLSEVLRKLPTELRTICGLLMTLNHGQARERLGMSRRKYDEAIAMIRQQFASSGLSQRHQ